MSEILAPCGGYESLAAALNAGADAVYVGLKEFSARKNAENFSHEEFEKAVFECHRRGVKIYAAVNTLVYDAEFSALADCVRFIASCGADGLIMQDLGAARLAREISPDIPLHASTQMTLNSVCGVKAAEKLGYSRVVIGRELSAEEIREIRENTSAELEIFVHGALCVSVSGQCYMSSVFGGRSGNRGLCAQPCRLDFSCGERHNVLSLKDSSLVPKLNDKIFKGISSFKIEGRMKRPEYVACAVNACREQLAFGACDMERLGGIFSRNGFTTGYFDGTMTDMSGIRGKEDVENSAKSLVGIKEIYKNEFPRIKLDISTEIKAGKRICARAECSFGEVFTQTETIPEDAEGAPLDERSVCDRMEKLGGTQFFAGKITAEVDGGLYVPASALNQLRRELCAKAEKLVIEKSTPKYRINSFKLPEKRISENNGNIKYRAEISDPEQLKQALELDFEMIYAPMGLLCEKIPDKDRIVVVPPLVLSDCEKETRSRLLELRRGGFSKGLAQTLGHAYLLKECGFEICGGYRMNVLNSLSAAVCAEFGMHDLTLSFEGKLSVLREIDSPIPRGILAYGRIPLMLLRRCPIADGKPCGKKTPFGEGRSCGRSIVDRRGNEFFVMCQGNCVEILNPDVLILSDKQEELSGFDFAVLKFTDEKEIAPVLEMYKTNGKPSGKLTRGLYFRGAE